MTRLKFLTIASIVVLCFLFAERLKRLQEPMTSMLRSEVTTQDPPCIQMYFYIEKYAQEFNIPRNFAYGIAYCETRYGGPFDWNYNPYQKSSAGALGPMQVMPNTAKFINGKKPTDEFLKTDIQYNVRTSMKLLRYLKDKYGDWKTVFGCYNTGRPMVNQYAINVYQFQPSW